MLAYLTPWTNFFSSGTPSFPEYVTDVAKRGPLSVTVTESGQLDSLKNANVMSNVQGLTTIISIVPEGTQVEAGDVVCELDASALIEQREKQEIAVTQAKGELDKAKENLLIQKTQNDSNLSAATLKNTLAQLDRDTFLNGQKNQEANEMRGNMLLAEDELSQAQEDYDFYARNAKKGYANQQEVESRRIRVNQAKNKLDVAKEKLNLLMEYTFNRRTKELEANVRESKLEIERVTRSGNAALAGFEADKIAKELTFNLENEKLKKLQQQIAACKLHAPQRGEVVYSEPDGRRGNDPQTIQEGASVRERQLILKLPDLSQMKVNVRIHESKIRRIRTGLPVQVQVQAFGGETFRGVLDTVSPIPMSGNWPNYDLREYDASVKIIDLGSRQGELKPGMTASVEIQVQNYDDVLQIPTQAAVNVGTKTFAFVLTDSGPVRRELKVQDSNDTVVGLQDGIRDGESIILNPRTQFAEEIAELETRYGAAPHDKSEAPKSPPATGPTASGPSQSPSQQNSPASGGERKERKKKSAKDEASPAAVASPQREKQS